MTRSKVGRDGPRCGAKLRQSDGYCTQVAGWATDHVGEGPCKLHGGRTRSVSKGAKRALLEADARNTLTGLNLEPVNNPLEALALHAAEVLALRDYLRGQVARLEELRYQGGSGEQVRAELSAYQVALRDTTAVLVSMARLDVDNRIVEINTRIGMAQGKAVADLIRVILAGLDLTPQQQAKARVVVVRELRAMSQESA